MGFGRGLGSGFAPRFLTERWLTTRAQDGGLIGSRLIGLRDGQPAWACIPSSRNLLAWIMRCGFESVRQSDIWKKALPELERIYQQNDNQ